MLAPAPISLAGGGAAGAARPARQHWPGAQPPHTEAHGAGARRGRPGAASRGACHSSALLPPAPVLPSSSHCACCCFRRCCCTAECSAVACFLALQGRDDGLFNSRVYWGGPHADDALTLLHSNPLRRLRGSAEIPHGGQGSEGREGSGWWSDSGPRCCAASRCESAAWNGLCTAHTGL